MRMVVSGQDGKQKNALFFIFLIFSLFALFSGSAYSLEIPKGIQSINDYNVQYAAGFLQKISLPIAFLAGIVSILSPCILPFLPVFFAYTFREKRNIFRMTSVFFMGFSVVFILMGLIASYIGNSIIGLQEDASTLILISGIFIIIFGMMSLSGKGFSSFIRISRSTGRNDSYGIFVFGIAFALGWTACLGPILAGILAIAGIMGNYMYSALLMLSYSLGIFVPLIAMSLLYDKYKLSESRLFKGRPVTFLAFGSKITLYSTNIISGLLLIITGLVFVIYRNTTAVNSFDPLRTKEYFYILQNSLINLHMGAALSAAFWIIFIIVLAYLVRLYREYK